MIRGVVNSQLEATIPVQVEGPGGASLQVTAIIDTGYNGALSLPRTSVTALALPRAASRIVTLGDASQQVMEFYTADVRWDGQLRHIRVLCVDGDPLVGTALLRGYRMRSDFAAGGSVALTRLR